MVNKDVKNDNGFTLGEALSMSLIHESNKLIYNDNSPSLITKKDDIALTKQLFDMISIKYDCIENDKEVELKLVSSDGKSCIIFVFNKFDHKFTTIFVSKGNGKQNEMTDKEDSDYQKVMIMFDDMGIKYKKEKAKHWANEFGEDAKLLSLDDYMLSYGFCDLIFDSDDNFKGIEAE